MQQSRYLNTKNNGHNHNKVKSHNHDNHKDQFDSLIDSYLDNKDKGHNHNKVKSHNHNNHNNDYNINLLFADISAKIRDRYFTEENCRIMGVVLLLGLGAIICSVFEAHVAAVALSFKNANSINRFHDHNPGFYGVYDDIHDFEL